MKKNKKILLIILLLIISIFIIRIFTYRQQNNIDVFNNMSETDYENSMKVTETYISSSEDYYRIRNKWMSEKYIFSEKKYIVNHNDISDGNIYPTAKNFGCKSNIIALQPGDKISFDVEVAEEGLYEIWLNYYVTEKTYLKPGIEIKINDSIQYNEMMNIELPIDWEVVRPEGRKQYDRYGDELTPRSEIALGWKTKPLIDPNHFFIEPLKFKFSKGNNKVTMRVKEGHVLLGDITIQNTYNSISSYKEYLGNLDKESTSLEQIITIEAEDMDYKSRQSIRAKYMCDPQVTPYEYKNRVLNVLDGYSFGDAGDTVKYHFTVHKSGFYKLAFKYYQNSNGGLPTHRRIEIDGKVPFKELEYYSFDYAARWVNETLQDDMDNPYKIYLEKGEHILTLSIDNSEVRDIYHELLITLNIIDKISQEVNSLTGGLVDKEREWSIEKYLPDISLKLQGVVLRINEQKNNLIEYLGSDELPVINELEIARKFVQEFSVKPEELPRYMEKFNEGPSSAYGRINTVLPMILYNPMHIDKIYLFNNEELPSAKASFVKSAYETSKSFFYSFFDPKYNEIAEVDNDTIEVWVNKSRLYVEIMQKMIDEEFTSKTGIKVNLSILPDENKIILSNAADSLPDMAVGISFAKPFELALRGMLEDLQGYEGFYELAEEFNPNTFIPYIYDQGVYAIPETQDVKLLFYRKDILDFLEVEPPQTWKDVLGLVPVLQRYNMNFFTPLGIESAYKGFDKTTPFIYQFGGELYNSSGSGTIINKDGAYDAFEFMVDLFTVYNIPTVTSNFYQHFRSGKLPVGISDANTYIQLKYAAPELAGQWGILPIPGIENREGVIERWDPTYGTTSIMFKDSKKKDMSWKFIKWWSSSNIQSEFSYQVQSTLGDKFLYMTANIEGFKKSAWPSDSKDIILEQWKWIQTTGKVPGDYMLEREISNAWNKAVFDGENPRVAIDDAVVIIDRELRRKLSEFGYVKNGKLIKPYHVPTINSVEKWVKENGK